MSNWASFKRQNKTRAKVKSKTNRKEQRGFKRKDNKVRKIHSTKFHAKLSENTQKR